jgi:hypothetical protein
MTTRKGKLRPVKTSALVSSQLSEPRRFLKKRFVLTNVVRWCSVVELMIVMGSAVEWMILGSHLDPEA